MFVVCCVGSGLCDVMINRSEESYKGYVPNCVRFTDLKTRRPSSIWATTAKKGQAMQV